jgi:hypothetical protein
VYGRLLTLMKSGVQIQRTRAMTLQPCRDKFLLSPKRCELPQNGLQSHDQYGFSLHKENRVLFVGSSLLQDHTEPTYSQVDP